MGGTPHNASAYGDAGAVAATQSNAPVDDFCAVCQAKGRVEAHYDDPWGTPVTLARVEVEEVGGGVLDSGGRTKSLATFGREDGQATVVPFRPDTGSHDYTADNIVPVRASLLPEGGSAAQVASLEQQIIEEIESFTASMQTALEPWITEWENSGWLGVVGSLFEGIGKGLAAWWEGEGEFWSSVGTWFSSLPDLIEGSWEKATDAAKALWRNRHQIWSLLEGLAQGSVERIERWLEALRDAFASIPSLVTSPRRSRCWSTTASSGQEQ
ncbi:MAG: hypothetical protein AAGH70_07175 [Pseudomonadota bacterium]